MGYANPDYYYQKIILDQTEQISDLKNQVNRLIKEKKQLQKELNGWH